MEKTLILFAHPALEKSRVNRELKEAVQHLEGITFHDLYEIYPDFHIDVEQEKALLLNHDHLIWQHPLYWYSVPALFKEWFDLVLEYGWAYGDGGNALAGKKVTSVITTGGAREAYNREGHNRYSIEEFLRPLERTAALCQMDYQKPLVFHSALHLEGESLEAAKTRYRDYLTSN
jgi:glutathione-regulated potassium-efflux system ancillary protein KefG